MATRVFAVAFRWVTTTMPDIARVERAMGDVGNWARLNIHVWFLKSTLNAQEISNRLRKEIEGEDSVVAILVDPTETQGWAPQWFWEWLSAHDYTNALVAPPSSVPSGPFSLTRQQYFVVLHQGQWKVQANGVHYGPYPTQGAAIRAAVDAAHATALTSTGGSQVLVQGMNNQWRTEWTYGKDPYPPKG